MAVRSGSGQKGNGTFEINNPEKDKKEIGVYYAPEFWGIATDLLCP